MILVDSSVWIDFLRGTASAEAELLARLIPREPLLVGDLILCEVLQGVPDEDQARQVEAALRRFEVVRLVDDALAVEAAGRYRALRGQGVTVRGTIDLLIGVFCLRHGHVLLHRDRDFAAMERAWGLRVLHA